VTGAATAAGRLPQPRSDLGAAAISGTAYLVGGYTGSSALDTILAWRPGQTPRVAGRLPHPLRYAAVAAAGDRIVIAGGTTPRGATHTILSFDPESAAVTKIGVLPAATTHAAAATLDGWVYVIGGRRAEGGRTSADIVAIDPSTGKATLAGRLPNALSDAAAIPISGGILLAGGRSGSGVVGDVLRLAPAPRPARDTVASRLLRPGSDPTVLPGDVLIADKANSRLLEVTPEGQIVWNFPRPGDLAPGQTFLVPDDAFYTHDGSAIVATQEDNFTISVIDRGSGKILYRAGTPGVPGASGGLLHNPDDAIQLGNGRLIAADIKNCRLIELRPPSHRPVAQLGATGSCYHSPPQSFGSPNGAFPLTGGGVVVTEINGDWIDVFDRHGHLRSTANPPHFSYPSDTNEVRPGLYLSVDYAKPGAIETFDSSGKLHWRFAPTGPDALDHPSLALPLPNGDILANDDYNDRVIVVDPHTNRIVWQYGHTGVAGARPGYLHIPDGVDLAPPYSLMDRFRRISGLPGH
jgi:DNA-binding beta-propeller fold protein YncE